MSPPYDALGIARAWLDDPSRAATLKALTFAPGPSRLAKHCLAPLLWELVSPVPLATVDTRALSLLDAAEAALLADLQSADNDIADVLDTIQQEIPSIRVRDLLSASDIQDRVAITMRGMLLPDWRQSTDNQGAPRGEFRPVWLGAPAELERSLHETAWLRRCKVWASAAGAGDELTFSRRWRQKISESAAAADPAGQSPNSVSLGLGDQQVPRIADDPPQPYEWRLATDRSFYSRVKLYWDGEHVPRDLGSADPAAMPPEERFACELTPGEALIRESIARTLAPLGMLLAEHRLLLESVVQGVEQAAANPGAASGAQPIPDSWDQGPGLPPHVAPLTASIRDHAAVRLAANRISHGDLDEPLYARCVARRFWIRLHAWELVGSHIPPGQLVRDLNIALDQSLNAAGVNRVRPTPVTIDYRRTENTLRIITEIAKDLQDAARAVAVGSDPPDRPDVTPDEPPIPDPSALLAEYAKRFSALRRDTRLQKNGGIHPPRWLQRKVEFRGEDL